MSRRAIAPCGALSFAFSGSTRPAAVVAFAVLLSACAASDAGMPAKSDIEPVYTSIREGDCRSVSGASMASFEKRGVTAKECRAPEGWRVYAVSSPERSWLEVGHDDRLWSSEQQIVYDAAAGNFPNLGADRIEWRVRSGVPQAVIFRISAEAELKSARDRPRTITRLAVVKLSPQGPRFCGMAASNAEARALADAPTPCETALPSR